ncbi:hypothetical protein [Sandaracinus amylolyticus]|uniref:hypothetical protein n=1 Tax=Sandaracinus amylolyticus TaxID=927083 RepID=UPI001F46CD81|nr:hypothetical protein [Sandaracinus amylolyticus]UJR84068.1 Hypothetical protein I5071_61390 [Sandaracinus amylolyticus]
MPNSRLQLSHAARPQFDRRRDRGLLGVLALTPGLLLTLAIATFLVAGTSSGAGLVLLASHVITQFIVLLIYGALLVEDEGLDPLGRALFAMTFLFGAPVALPVYYLLRVLIPAGPEARGWALAISPRVVPA